MPDYPTESELDEIKSFEPGPTFDFRPFMNLAAGAFNHVYGFWGQKGRTYRVSTGGWSGNEDVINAMQDNILAWSVLWVQSRRGGHFIFQLPRKAKKTP